MIYIHIAKKKDGRHIPHCSLGFLAPGASKISDAGRFAPGAGDPNLGERRSCEGSTAGDLDRDRFLGEFGGGVLEGGT